MMPLLLVKNTPAGGGGGGFTPATWNPSDKHADIALSGGNLVATSAGTNGGIYTGVRSTLGKSSGKWYWENTFTSGLYLVSGAGESTQGLSPNTSFDTVSGFRIYHPNGNKYVPVTAYGATLAAGDVVGCALDMTAGTLILYKNGVSQGTLVSSLSGTFYAYLLEYDGSVTVITSNFGATPFTYAVPAGYNAGLYTGARATATWNPADKSANITLSSGDLRATASGTGSGLQGVRSTLSKTSGKWFWEITCVSGTYSGTANIGIGSASQPITDTGLASLEANSVMDDFTGAKYSGAGAYGLTFNTGDVIGVALDMDGGNVYLYKNGAILNGGTAMKTGISGATFAYFANEHSGPDLVQANFGATPFTYAVPAGYNPGLFA